ncbi:hypothetical protein PK28_02570 [Hymenobacter sp. DG25B]|uniref:hypothetical protein n=1 Tax=Hymenobacter sp. DG25B TaxID=1385664 RepID=UPI00054078BD|nr:hypothetical protein [Hymenobacter sp. DG25B]AIZ62844.1 hypothetical protein PK28_02570 [Hymenobacter sp. DG25B]
MKKSLTTFLSALALVALGSCAGPAALTTESDGVYYSSKDQTTADPALAAVQANRDLENAPSDQSSTATPESRANQGQQREQYSDSYSTYDDDEYTYMARIRRFHQPSYWSFAPGYYDYAYTSYAYDPWFYNDYAYGSRYGYYDPFYDPFFYGGGSYVNISIGWGWPYSRRHYGYGYGYGGGGYDWGYRNGYRNGYNNGYYNNRYNDWGRASRDNTYYGPRRDRSNNVGTGNSSPRGRGVITDRRAIDSRTNTSGGTSISVPATEAGRPASTSPASERRIPARGRIEERNADGGIRGSVSDPASRPGRMLESQPQVPASSPAREVEETPRPQPRRTRSFPAGSESREERPTRQAEQPRRERVREYTPERSEQPSRSYERSTERNNAPASRPTPSSGNNNGSRGRGRIN